MRVEPPSGASFVIPAVRPVLGPTRFAVRGPDPVADAATAECASPRAGRWAKEARLSSEDLTVRFEAPVQGGVARFNVADAGGYRGARKCNLFALEMAHRAGFRVPLAARAHGVGFPGADAMSRQAGEGKVGEWASVVDRASRESLDALRAKGACLLAVASAPGRRQGHVVVVDRVLDLVRGGDGRIERVRFAGWDAGADGARRRVGTMSLACAGGRFDEIHLLSLVRRGGAILQSDVAPGRSVLDLRRV